MSEWQQRLQHVAGSATPGNVANSLTQLGPENRLAVPHPL